MSFSSFLPPESALRSALAEETARLVSLQQDFDTAQQALAEEKAAYAERTRVSPPDWPAGRLSVDVGGKR